MKYSIEINTKFTSMLEIISINKRKFPHPENITRKDLSHENGLDFGCGDIPFCVGIPDNFGGKFQVKIKDENGNVIYESDVENDFRKFYDLPVVSSEVITINVNGFEEDFVDEVFDKEMLAASEAYNNNHPYDDWKPGYYLVLNMIEKTSNLLYHVETEEPFDIDKLRFVPMNGYRGIESCRWATPSHLLYKTKYLEQEDDDGIATEYLGTFYSIYRKHKDGEWECIKELNMYEIDITTKGTFTPEIFSLEGYKTPETLEEAQAIIEEQVMGEIPICNAMGEDFGGNDFEVTVYDECGNAIYESDDFYAHFGTSIHCEEDGEEWYEDDEEFDTIVEKHNKAAEKFDTFEPRLYLVKIIRDHWGGASYELETDTFDQDKLRFVPMGEFEDLYFGDDTTDLDHLTYDKQYLEKDDDFTPPDVYWEELYLYEKKRNGVWGILKKFES